jgi:TolB-like protein
VPHYVVPIYIVPNNVAPIVFCVRIATRSFWYSRRSLISLVFQRASRSFPRLQVFLYRIEMAPFYPKQRKSRNVSGKRVIWNCSEATVVQQIEFGSFVLDLDRVCLLRGSDQVKLRPQTFRMLHYLVENGGRLLTKSELMKALWGDTAVTDDSLVQCLREVRVALDDRDHAIVRTVPRRGYVFALRPRLSSIAVLPFVDMSSESEKVEHLTDGLAEELISMLSQAPGLRVASRSSSSHFRGKAQNVAELGRVLNVSAILEGSIRRSGDQLRISVQLVNTSDGHNLWSETYDRRMGEVIATQEEIATAIVSNLVEQVSGDSGRLRSARYATNAEAHHLYLTGRYFWNKRTKAGFEKAIKCWQRAIARDPDCALAYSGIADAYCLLGYYGYLRPLEAFEAGRAAACRAIEINEGLAEPHVSLAELMLLFQGDDMTCARELTTAVGLDSAYARAHHTWSHYWISVGNVDRSFEASRRALDLDPASLPLIAHQSWHHYHASEFDHAIAAGQRAIEMDPSFTMARIYLGRAYALNRMHDEAIKEFDKCLAEGSADIEGYLALTFALAGERVRAERMLADLVSASADQYVSSYHFGAISLALGDVDGAFRWLDKAVEEHGRHVAALRLDPALARIRNDPRFDRLLVKIESLSSAWQVLCGRQPAAADACTCATCRPIRLRRG